MPKISVGLFEKIYCHDCDDHAFARLRGDGEKYCVYCGGSDTEIQGIFEGGLSETTE